jgi:hypothetical protein
MQTIEFERAAYIANDPTAALLARIADLERQCVIYENALTRIVDGGPALSGDECALMAYEVL